MRRFYHFENQRLNFVHFKGLFKYNRSFKVYLCTIVSLLLIGGEKRWYIFILLNCVIRDGPDLGVCGDSSIESAQEPFEDITP